MGRGRTGTKLPPPFLALEAVVDLLIGAGADVEQTNLTGLTPIMLAARYGVSHPIDPLEHPCPPSCSPPATVCPPQSIHDALWRIFAQRLGIS